MLVLTLILVPLAAGLVLLCLKPDLPRKILVSGVTLAVCCGSVALALLPTPLDLGELPLSQHWINLGMLLVEMAMSLFILYVGVRAKHPLIVLLTLAQAGLMVWFEFTARRASGGGAESVRGQVLRHHGPDQRHCGRRHLPLRAGLHARIPRSGASRRCRTGVRSFSRCCSSSWARCSA